MIDTTFLDHPQVLAVSWYAGMMGTLAFMFLVVLIAHKTRHWKLPF